MVTKNIARINHNLDNPISPSFYFSNKTNVTKVYNDKDIFTHYKPAENNLCGFLKSPCSHLSKNLTKINYWSYKIYYKE